MQPCCCQALVTASASERPSAFDRHVFSVAKAASSLCPFERSVRPVMCWQFMCRLTASKSVKTTTVGLAECCEQQHTRVSVTCLGAHKTTLTQGFYEPWFLEPHLSWTLEPKCRILVFMWSLGPVLLGVSAMLDPLLRKETGYVGLMNHGATPPWPELKTAARGETNPFGVEGSASEAASR